MFTHDRWEINIRQQAMEYGNISFREYAICTFSIIFMFSFVGHEQTSSKMVRNISDHNSRTERASQIVYIYVVNKRGSRGTDSGRYSITTLSNCPPNATNCPLNATNSTDPALTTQRISTIFCRHFMVFGEWNLGKYYHVRWKMISNISDLNFIRKY